MGEIAIGRKSVMRLLDVQSWRTVRSWERDKALPLRRHPNGKPMIIMSEYRRWLIAFSDIKKAM
jgi:hypothetical protein